MLKVEIKKKIGTNGDFFSVDASFEVGEEILVIYGPSGSGKTLILNLISGIIKPDSGTISLDGRTLFRKGNGKDIDIPIYERRVGYIFQTPSLFPHLTIKENTLYGMRRKNNSILDSLLDSLRLSGLEDRYPEQLSLGQQQRVSIARTLATSPEILLMDEPFSALDERTRERLRLDFKRVHSQLKIPTLFVTHDLCEAYSLADRIAVLNSGKIEQNGSPGEILSRPATRAVARFVGMKNIFEGSVLRKDILMGETVISWEGHLIKAPYTQVSVGKEVVWMIRPENIVFQRPNPNKKFSQENIFWGKIVEVLHLGTNISLFVRTGDKDKDYDFEMHLPVHVYEKYQLEKGKRIQISLKKESVHLIEKFPKAKEKAEADVSYDI